MPVPMACRPETSLSNTRTFTTTMLFANPRIDRGIVADKIPGFGVGPGGGRYDQGRNLTGANSLRDIWRFYLNRRGNGEGGKLLKRGVVGAEALAGQVFNCGDFAICIKTLGGAGHLNQRHQTLLG